MNNYAFSTTEISTMLSTRLCHDLAGPISAVNNGIELTTSTDHNMDKAMLGQVQELLQLSSHESLAKLQMFRMAYGKATKDITADIKELQDIIESYYANSKLSLSWNIESDSGKITLSNRRLITLGCLVASSMMIFGGTLHITADEHHIGIAGTHDRIKQDEQLAKIFTHPQPKDVTLTTDNILAHYLVLITAEAHKNIHYTLSESNLHISLKNML